MPKRPPYKGIWSRTPAAAGAHGGDEPARAPVRDQRNQDEDQVDAVEVQRVERIPLCVGEVPLCARCGGRRRESGTESAHRAVNGVSRARRCSGGHIYKADRVRVDHVATLVDGGRDEPANVQTLCSECHLDKANAEHALRGAGRKFGRPDRRNDPAFFALALGVKHFFI
ncbi:HNH endonuclease [Allokutzneria oryzae]|uniref:HNH endonuclease n=1 Tax=Allokutzneria oryzae TaxID=1378989 RepID=A0ABV6A2M2_9PSEU